MNRFYTSDEGTKQAFSWQCNLGAGCAGRGCERRMKDHFVPLWLRCYENTMLYVMIIIRLIL